MRDQPADDIDPEVVETLSNSRDRKPSYEFYSTILQDRQSHFANYLGLCVNCCASSGLRMSLCCGVIILVILLLVPFNPVWYYGNAKIKQVIETHGSRVTGVQVQVGAVRMFTLWGGIEIDDLIIPNPEGYLAAPYFMKCQSISTGVSPWQVLLTNADFIHVAQLTLTGVSVFVEQRFGVESNAVEIMNNWKQSPLGHYAEDNIVHSKERKYMVDRVKIEGMEVQMQLTALPVALIDVPPMYVEGIGQQEGGVIFEVMMADLVHALTVSALRAKNIQVRANMKNKLDAMSHEEQRLEQQTSPRLLLA